MKLTNVVIQFTVTIPELEVDKELEIGIARSKCFVGAHLLLMLTAPDAIIEKKIKDCPAYPALCD